MISIIKSLVSGLQREEGLARLLALFLFVPFVVGLLIGWWLF